MVDAEREEGQPDLGRRPVLHEEGDGDLYLISIIFMIIMIIISIIFMIITFTMTIIITKVTESAKKKEEFYWDEKEVTEEAPANTGRRSISGIRFLQNHVLKIISKIRS